MQPLRNLIIKDIKKKGKITFAEFMRMVLYHPKYGYYNSNIERVGKFGDYYTSPTVHRMFGDIIAKQLEEMWRIMGKDAFTVVEMGVNKGWLCHDIIQCIRKEYPKFYDNLHYIIIESNPYAREKQRLLLDSINLTGEIPLSHTLAKRDENTTPSSPPCEERGRSAKNPLLHRKVSWHTYTENGFSFNKIQGCFLSNEFVDALPVHRLRVKNKILKEVYVGYNNANLCEIDDEVSNQALKHYLETHQSINDDQWYEVNVSAPEWLKYISEKLTKGFVITIDYGDTIDGIYRENDVDGTLRCYYKHTVNRDYYERLGKQDITASVDFANLMDAGRSVGLETTGFTKQSHFLIALGILERLNTMNNDLETILKVKNLLHPEGMGEIFKVLIQHKNIENPQLTSLRPLHSITI